MKPDELAYSLAIGLALVALHQRGIFGVMVRVIRAQVSEVELEIPPEQPELAAGNAELSRAYELTRAMIERARAA